MKTIFDQFYSNSFPEPKFIDVEETEENKIAKSDKTKDAAESNDLSKPEDLEDESDELAQSVHLSDKLESEYIKKDEKPDANLPADDYEDVEKEMESEDRREDENAQDLNIKVTPVGTEDESKPTKMDSDSNLQVTEKHIKPADTKNKSENFSNHTELSDDGRESEPSIKNVEPKTECLKKDENKLGDKDVSADKHSAVKYDCVRIGNLVYKTPVVSRNDPNDTKKGSESQDLSKNTGISEDNRDTEPESKHSESEKDLKVKEEPNKLEKDLSDDQKSAKEEDVGKSDAQMKNEDGNIADVPKKESNSQVFYEDVEALDNNTKPENPKDETKPDASTADKINTENPKYKTKPNKPKEKSDLKNDGTEKGISEPEKPDKKSKKKNEENMLVLAWLIIVLMVIFRDDII